MLTLEVKKSAQVIVLRCSGRIVRGDGAESLLRAVTSEAKRNILIDLNGVKALDAAGLGALAELESWSRKGNRTLHLINPSPQVREALDATGLSSVLQIVPTADKTQHHAA